MTAQKTILVTGGAGYIGSHTCKTLAAAGYRPVVLDNLVYGHRSAVKWGPFVRGDLADATSLGGLIRRFKVSAIIHFAAYAYVGESMEWPGKYFQNNVAGTLNLLEAARVHGVEQFVFSSTCATYGVPRDLPISEEHRQTPVNPYGESKLFIERALAWYDSAHEFRSVALRYFNAAGADPDGEIGEDHEPETHLIPLVIQAAAGDRPHIDVYGTDYPTPDGTAIRDYIHVTDLAAAHVAALAYLEKGGATKAINLGTGEGHSVRQVIHEVEQYTGCPVPVRESPRRAGDPPVLVADAHLAERVLGWTPHHSSLPEIIATAWNWHQGRSMPQYARALP
jgi:UDP-glucose-4-epimerase GalE